MKVTLWYVLSILSGLLLAVSLAEMAKYIEWTDIAYDLNRGESPFYPGAAREYGDGWLIVVAISLPVAIVSLLKLRTLVPQISKEDWFKIGLITAILIAPVIFVTAFRWEPFHY
jgi:hypothetical protein